MQPTPPSKPSAAPSRLLVVSPDLCKPKNCKRECQRTCPVVRMGAHLITAASTRSVSQSLTSAPGKACVQVTGQRAHISENLCIGCGICVKVPPLTSTFPALIASLCASEVSPVGHIDGVAPCAPLRDQDRASLRRQLLRAAVTARPRPRPRARPRRPCPVRKVHRAPHTRRQVVSESGNHRARSGVACLSGIGSRAGRPRAGGSLHAARTRSPTRGGEAAAH